MGMRATYIRLEKKEAIIRFSMILLSESTYVCNLLKDALRGLSAPAAWQTPEKFFI